MYVCVQVLNEPRVIHEGVAAISFDRRGGIIVFRDGKKDECLPRGTEVIVVRD